jgi:hypothetical protein
VNKNILATATLVAALPAAFLGYFLVSTFLTQLDHLSTMFTVLAAATLLCCSGVVFLPLAILIFGPKSERAPKAAKEAKKTSAAKDAKAEAAPESGLEVEAVGSDALEAVSGDVEWGEEPFAETVTTSTGDLPVVEGAMTMDELGAVNADLSEADMTQENLDVFDDEEFAFDEDEEPKKKKKK